MFAHFQLFVHLDKFRNLDLFHQGEYAIRVRVYSTGSCTAARPVDFVELDELEVPSSNPGGVNDPDSSFRVSSFYIRCQSNQHTAKLLSSQSILPWQQSTQTLASTRTCTQAPELGVPTQVP